MVSKRRRRGEGTISIDTDATERNGKPTYVVRVSLGVIKGKLVRRKAVAHSEKDARAALERLKRLYGGGDISQATLEQYLRTWLVGHRNVRPSTLVSYQGHVDLHINPLLGGIKVAKLRPSDVDRLIAAMLDKSLSPTTVHRVITTLRMALKDGVERGEVPSNVATRVELPNIPERVTEPLTVDEAAAILDAVEGHWSELIVRVLLGSGMRLGEACALNQGDVDLAGGYVRLRESKTRIRSVPVNDDALAALRLAIAAAPRVGADEPLFFGPRPNRRGHRDRLHGWSVSHAFPRLLQAKGLDRLVPHGLRHGHATLMLEAGYSLPVIAAQLGHRSTRMTERYAHVVPTAQRAAVASTDVRARRQLREEA